MIKGGALRPRCVDCAIESARPTCAPSRPLREQKIPRLGKLLKRFGAQRQKTVGDYSGSADLRAESPASGADNPLIEVSCLSGLERSDRNEDQAVMSPRGFTFLRINSAMSSIGV